MMNGGYGFGGWGIFGMIFQFAIMIGVLYFAVYFFQSVFNRNGSNSGYLSKGKTSLQILEERYARGEIEEDEYKQKRRVLKE